MNKKVMFVGILCLLVFLVGCLDYQAYEVPEEQDSSDADLLQEIEQIEKELAVEGDLPDLEVDDQVAEETVELPELGEEPVQSEELFVKSVKENDLVRLNTVITDPDNDPITFSFTAPINASGEWKTNYGDAGEYIITLTATDGKLTTSKKIKLIVERVNVPPVISSFSDITVNEGQAVEFTPQVSDPNNDAVSVSVSEPLAGGSFITDHTSAGVYNIQVTASDGELESSSSFTLTINDVNEKPVISNVEDISIKEGDVVKINPEVSDLDGDEVTVTISDPVGDDGVWETSYTDNGEYSVTVTVSDGKDTVVKKLKIIVEDVNKAPEIIDITLTTS